MRRSVLAAVMISSLGTPDLAGCGDGDMTGTAGDVGSGATDPGTGASTSSGDATSTDTDEDGSGTAPSTTEDPTNTTTADETGGSMSTGAEESETGGLAGCQHAWDFARCPQGWTTERADPAAPGASSWACGEPSGGLSQGGAHTGVWGTNLSGNYGEDESSALISPAFSLADCAGATLYLTFAHLYEFGSGDGGTVQVSTDGGGTWSTVEPVWNGYCGGTLGVPWSPPGGEPGFCGGDDETWLHTLVEIDDLGGQSDVRVRFVMGSNGIIEQLGWYIDRVGIEAY